MESKFNYITDLLKDTTAKVEVCNVIFFDESNITLKALQNLKFMGAHIKVSDLTYESHKALQQAHVVIFLPTNQILKSRY